MQKEVSGIRHGDVVSGRVVSTVDDDTVCRLDVVISKVVRICRSGIPDSNICDVCPEIILEDEIVVLRGAGQSPYRLVKVALDSSSEFELLRKVQGAAYYCGSTDTVD